jgi:Cu(I)/Ag(I) efflux system protein CusF
MKNVILLIGLVLTSSVTSLANLQIVNFNLFNVQLKITQSLPQVKGEIKKIDLAQKKITIKHEDIPNLDMPGMTMVFQVDVTVDLTAFKASDKILFSVDKINGAYTVLTLKKAN